jgi:type III pantothenate kinase
MQFLLIDIGNTRAKWAVATRERIQCVHDFATADFIRGRNPVKRLRYAAPLEGAIIACVVPKALAGVKAALRRAGVPRPLVVSPDLDLGIRLRYPNPRQLGADRLVNAVAAATLYGAPAVAIDCGTAITFNVVNARREFVGGVIAPGPATMLEALHQRTALLPRCLLSEPRSAIGRNTTAAMQAGAVIGARGLIREILASIRREPCLRGKRLQVVATGGHARLLAAGLPEIRHIHPRLTLEGLRILYARNAR